MTGTVIDSVGSGVYRVTGDLVFATANETLAHGRRLIPGQRSLTFDLAGVSRSDSAGLAVLLEWIDVARGAGVALAFTNLPGPLLDIARLSNAEALLAPQPA